MRWLQRSRALLSAAGLLTLFALAGCPNGEFRLGIDPDSLDAGGGDVNDASNEPDEVACGSRGLAECPEGEYCSYPEAASCGEADAPGVCRAKPEVCTEQYQPVCGCDGMTYGNDCSAASAGVSVRTKGECPGDTDPAKVCGGFSGKSCDDREYCNFSEDALCGIADASGVCEKRPDACDDSFDPVCGCDGVTYANACEAAIKGAGVMNQGKCADQERICGDGISTACQDGSYCKYPQVGQCGVAELGECVERPEICTEQYEPVCGCDGNTYGNACTAASAGVSVASEGECPVQGDVCGVRGAQPCADDEYCYFTEQAQCAAADVPGHCRPRPEQCSQELSPVCGCDGKTYDNACTAAVAGVSAAHSGKCGAATSDGTACGGLQGLACPDGQYCHYAPDAQCGAADQQGACQSMPAVCTKEYRPVCGCDDKTYGNACEAAAAGVSTISEGECGASQAAACGGLQGLACPDGQYCHYAPDAQCGAADQQGVCDAIPSACTREYRPVCGCDDKTYGNACEAAAAGVSTIGEGECQTAEATCGGLTGAACPDAQFCEFAPTAMCGAADQTGVCRDRPDVCTTEVAPVCGCDDTTYSNACNAQAAGVSVLHDGPC